MDHPASGIGMRHPSPSIAALVSLAETVDHVLGGLLHDGFPVVADDAEVVESLTLAGRILRRVEGVLTESVGVVMARSSSGDVESRLTSRFGCHDVSELVQRATLVAPQTAARFQRAARAVRCETSIATGEQLQAQLPAIREAMLEGDAGLDGVLAVAGPLGELSRGIDRDSLLAADQALADACRGEGADGSPPACADLLRVQATAWSAVLDQDGSEPRERQAMHRRSVTLGAARNGLVPLRGNLLPEVAAQFQRICDAIGSPRVVGDTGGVRFRPDGDGDPYSDEAAPIDERRTPQRRHDAMATALFAAAASATLPTIGAAAPTLIVSVRECDLVAGRGWAHVDGRDEPVPVGTAVHTGCAGVIQRILRNDEGRILRIGTEERLFNRHQRRAIALRDGGCLIPGCGVPASWCEVHHVSEHAHGGPTHTDNGVLLCWYHHRHLGSHGWKIRIARGVPEVRAPGWNDSSLRWRRVTKSKTRLVELVARRT